MNRAVVFAIVLVVAAVLAIEVRIATTKVDDRPCLVVNPDGSCRDR